MDNNMINKLKTMLVLAAAVFAIGCSEQAAQQSTATDKSVPQLSVQLWSVKTTLKDDFAGTIGKIADMGFEGVEFAGDFGPYQDDPAGLRKFLASKGLTASGAHIKFELFDDENFDKSVAFFKDLGVELLIVGWDERAWHPEGIHYVVERLNTLSVKLAPHGMKIGFHNHDHEFDEFEGTTYWDFMAVNTNNDVVLQQDVGWTTYAGHDPVEYVKRYPNRTITTHYKVRLPEGTEGKLPIIGQDTIDWMSLLNANIEVGGTKWIVVEQEEYPNGMTPLEAVAASKSGLMEYIGKL